jgi:hypothetical protein
MSISAAIIGATLCGDCNAHTVDYCRVIVRASSLSISSHFTLATFIGARYYSGQIFSDDSYTPYTRPSA